MINRALQLTAREKRSGATAPGSLGFVNAFSSASSSDSQRLAGKVAVITGGASGIGKATAAEFVRHGAKVIIADVQDDLGHAVVAELGPAAACYARCDVTDEAQVAAAVDLAISRHGSPLRPPLADSDLAGFDRVMATNARGVLAGLKHAARVMVPRRRGSIICTASVAGVVGSMAAPLPYAASKAAVLGMVRAVAAEMARAGVRVNAISPSWVPTPMTLGVLASWFPGKSDEEIRRMIEVDMGVMEGTALEAEDIARAALYLASDEAKYVNGHNLLVDGGSSVSRIVKNAGATAPRECQRDHFVCQLFSE